MWRSARVATQIGQLKGDANAYLTNPNYGTLRLRLENAHAAVEAATVEARRRVNKGNTDGLEPLTLRPVEAHVQPLDGAGVDPPPPGRVAAVHAHEQHTSRVHIYLPLGVGAGRLAGIESGYEQQLRLAAQKASAVPPWSLLIPLTPALEAPLPIPSTPLPPEPVFWPRTPAPVEDSPRTPGLPSPRTPLLRGFRPQTPAKAPLPSPRTP